MIPLYFLVQFFVTPPIPVPDPTPVVDSSEPLAIAELEKLKVSNEVRSGYKRDNFGSGWAKWLTCDTRQKILNRDLYDTALDTDNCAMLSGTLDDPYTGEKISFLRGSSTSSAVQIDHVVALANAWATGAADWEKAQRVTFANDDLELLAVDGPANMQKGSADAANWLPGNKPFRCQYVARQIAVKVKYALWVSTAEHDAMDKTLATCPGQRLPSP
ncbi:hypothetical protein FACS189431_3650 [Alphaproteobacteria bacterium]|nr:hypothetical protein FACS189431_3650 [Alphaproteobacteria bacterium]